MLKLAVVLALVVCCKAMILCPHNVCDTLQCPDVTACNGRVNEKGGWCGCCDVCMTQLGELVFSDFMIKPHVKVIRSRVHIFIICIQFPTICVLKRYIIHILYLIFFFVENVHLIQKWFYGILFLTAEFQSIHNISLSLKVTPFIVLVNIVKGWANNVEILLKSI